MPRLPMRLLPMLLLFTACAAPRPAPDADGVLVFGGQVTAIDTGCYVDGACTATVAGVVVTTMTGERLDNPIWGEQNTLPAVGQHVDVRCMATAPGACTLKGDRGYYLRPRP